MVRKNLQPGLKSETGRLLKGHLDEDFTDLL